MEGSVRSGGVLKKKTSSGCLIIKKKVDNRNSGGGLRGSGVNSNEKKRPRLVANDSGASDEDDSLEFMRRRKVNDKRLHNGSMGYESSELEVREYNRNNFGIDISGERKRSRLNLYDFDEYDEFEGKRMRNEYMEDGFMMGGGNSKEFDVGSSRRKLMLDKRKHASYFDGSSSGRGKGIEYAGVRNKGFDLEEDEAQMPKSLVRLKYQETTDEPIRLQGKNGVLKVMVNKKKKMDFHSHPKKYDPREVEERGGSWSEDVMKKDMSGRLPVFPASKLPEKKQGLFLDKEKMIEKERMEVKLAKVKPVLSKGIKKARESEFDGLSTGKKVRDLVSNGTDTALKLAPPGAQASSSKKRVKKEEVKIIPAETVTPVKGKEGKAKRGGSTEKQMLREKIREMLLDAGWTIDYRPRRNRDYLDAVYINRSGTAYWSIIKAYEALKKQLEEDKNKSKADVGSPSFAPLAEDLINKLTRQTKKKIEEEMKRKRKEDGLTKSAKRSAAGDAGDSSDSDHNEERFSSYMKQNYKSKKSKSREVDQESDDELSDDSPKRKMRKVRAEKPSIAFRSTALQARTSKVIGRCTLLVRGSDRGENSESDGYVPYRGKRTVLAWLIDSGTAQLSEKVQYMNRRKNRVMLEGWMTREGIHCGCCSKILTVSKFELHAGSKLRQPYQNIFLESGASLLQCQVDAWNKQGESICRDFHTVDVDGDGDDPDDDTCGLCGDGGALICCDSCPSTFHPVCLGIQMLPSGDWHCPNCTCKFCGDASGNIDGENDSTADELIRCSFCEKKYHKSCSEEVDTVPMSSNSAPFCGLKCQELYDHLQKILGVKHELEAGYAWSFIQRTDVSDTSNRGFPQRVECNSKLAVALSVMEECFLPIIDRRSRINMIHNVVYNCGSNFNRLNYRGFYTAILERGDEIVSAASIRIHGTRLAEMPFIGTRAIYRRQGMCRRLLSAIETELCSLKVEQLIIPAISEHMNTWTRVFGFHQLEDVVKKEIKSMNMLVFPGTDMLQKDLVKQETSEDLKFSESIKNETETSGKVNSVDSSSPSPAVPSNDNSAASASDSACESDNILLAQNGTIVVKSEVENKQEVSSADMENGLLTPLVKDTDANSCKIEVSFPKSIHDSSNDKQKPSDLESAEFANGNGNVKACEDAEHQTSVNNGSLESPLGSVSGKINSSTDDDDVEENDTCDRETDKPDVESNMEVDRKVSSPSSSSEASD